MDSSLLFLDKGETHQYNLSLTTKDYRLPDMLYQFYPSSHASINITVISLIITLRCLDLMQLTNNYLFLVCLFSITIGLRRKRSVTEHQY